MRTFMKSRKGEGYIDVVIGMLCLLMTLVVTMNIYQFFTIKQDLDEISQQLIECATYNGCFSDEFYERADELENQFFPFDVSVSADEYFNASYKRVQLGDKMDVTVSMETYVQGVGVFKIPVTIGSHRSGISEKYWK